MSAGKSAASAAETSGHAPGSLQDDPVITYNRETGIVTIDGFRFSREVFSHFTASPLGVRFRIIERKDGVITISQERDALEDAARDLLNALSAITSRYVDLASSGDCGFWNPEDEPQVQQARAAIAKAEGRS